MSVFTSRTHAQVIKANDDLTPEHHQFFLYQMLRGLKYIHTGWCTPHLVAALLQKVPVQLLAAAAEVLRCPRAFYDASLIACCCSQGVPQGPEAEEHPGQQRLQAQSECRTTACIGCPG